MSKQYTFKKYCRICGNNKFDKILDLGQTPLANAFLTENEITQPEPSFPLVVYICKKCKLVGLRNVVKPEILFKNYHYLTGASSPLTVHFKKLAKDVFKKNNLTQNSLVVEIGSNDGDLLSNLVGKCKVLGIDPADNVAKIAESKGVKTITGFFSDKTAKSIVKNHGPADIIIANNVIAHIDNLHSVFSGINTLLTKNGKFIFESHWVGNLIGEGGYDQIYHEHLCYFSLHAINFLVKKFNLKILDVSLLSIHGQSIRVTAGKTGKPEKSVQSFLKTEKKLGLHKEKTFVKFAQKVAKSRTDLITLLEKLKKDNKKITGYGAPAKGNTLLNYCGITPKTLDFITDTTLLKQNHFTPGTHIKIVAPEILKTVRPDYILLLSWNYAKVILEKESELRKNGVKFIVPVPEVKIV